MKRQTLGQISDGQANSRMSVGGFGASRVAKDGKGLKTLVGRPSLRPTENNNAARKSMGMGAVRHSSQFGKSGTAVKQDPRPVGDRGFQQQGVSTLIQYLSSHGYEHAISPKLLTSPTGRDFANIIQFLMRQLDPNLSQKHFGKVEDEVPQLFKRLKYPLQISKTALVAVGSPHAWPTLLAALVWLVELLNYGERADEDMKETFDEKRRSDSDQFEHIGESYAYFLRGNDEQEQMVEQTRQAEFESLAGDISEQTDEMRKANDLVRQQIADLRSQPLPLVLAQEKKMVVLEDREKFNAMIENLQKTILGNQRKAQEKQADIKSKQQQLAAAERENQELLAKVASQTVNRDDVIRMNNEKAKMDEALQKISAQRQAVDKRVRDQEKHVERRLEELDALLLGYNRAAERVQLVPMTAKRAEGRQFEVHLDRAATSSSDLVDVDFKVTVKPELVSLKERTAARERDLIGETLALQERLDSGSHTLTERAEENACLEAQVRKLEGQFRAAKEAAESEVGALAAQADQLRSKAGALRSSASVLMADSDERVRELQEAYDARVRLYAAEVKAIDQDVLDVVNILIEHKGYVQALIGRVESGLEAVRDEVKAVAV